MKLLTEAVLGRDNNSQFWDIAQTTNPHRLVAVSNSGIKIYDLTRKQPSHTLNGAEEHGAHLVESVGESCVALAMRYGKLAFFDVKTLEYVSICDEHIEEEHGVYGLAYFPVQKELLSVGESKEAILWDLSLPHKPQIVNRWTTGFSVNYAAAIENDVVLAHDTGVVSRRNANTGEVLWQTEAHNAQILDLAIADGFVLSASRDQTAAIIDAATGKILQTLHDEDEGPKDDVNAVLHLNGTIVTFCDGGVFQFWSAETGKFLGSDEPTEKFKVLRMRQLSDQTFVAVGMSEMGVHDDLEFRMPYSGVHVFRLQA